MKNEFIYKKISDASTQFICIDDIQNVIDGRPPKSADKLWKNAQDYSFGLGNGALDNINGLGELVLINGEAYTKSTDNTSAQYYKLASSKKFMTSWIFLLPANPVANFNVTYEQTTLDGLTLDGIYQRIYDKLKKPFAVTGIVNFSTMKGAAIAKSPIENQNIFEHKDVYYPDSVEVKNVCAALVGVVANIEAIIDPTLADAIKKVVYYNPLEAAANLLTTHEHVLILKNNVARIEDVSIIDAADVEHLFTQSTITHFNLNVFEINHIQMRSID